MAAQPDLTAILAALAQRNGGTPNPQASSTPQPPVAGGYPGAPTPSNGGFALPQPTNSGSLDLSSIKPASSGTVSLADAIAKARSISDKARNDPRVGAGAYGAGPGSPTQRANYRDNYNPFRDERRDGRATNGRDRSASPQGRNTFSPATRTYGRDRSPPPAGGADGGNTETITVESSSVGLIIGRQGENLKRVEAETGARVQFITGPDTSAPLRQCKLTGTPRQRDDAKREIYRIVAENPRAPPKSTPQPVTSQQSPPLREGEASMQIMVPDKTVGLIIGRSGETIRDIQERSGCHVNILGENRSINGFRPVNLIGSMEASQKAKELILEVVDSDTRAAAAGAQNAGMPSYGGGAGGGGGAGRNPPPQRYDAYGGAGGYDPTGGANAKVNDTLMVPSEAVGMIIGKGGESIKDMQAMTGCKINVTQPAGADIQREIGLIGTRSAIEAAKRAIWEKVENVRAKQGGALRGETANPGYGDPYQQRQPAPYGAPAPGPMPPMQGMPPPVGADQPDPYAAYGGYQNYLAMWTAALANSQGGGYGQPHH